MADPSDPPEMAAALQAAAEAADAMGSGSGDGDDPWEGWESKGPQPSTAEELAAIDDMPFFMTAVPPDPESNDAFAGLMELKWEGKTPTEIALELKDRGNDAFRKGTTKGYQEAIGEYTDGLAQECNDMMVNAALYANRGMAELKLGNNRRAINDCMEAVERNPQHVKSYFRLATAHLNIGLLEESRLFAERGLACDDVPESSRKSLQDVISTLDAKAERARAKEAKKAAAEAAVMAEQMALRDAIIERNVAIGPPVFEDVDKYDGMIMLDPESGQLVWPIIILYPEYQTTDFIQGMFESATVGDVIDSAFPADGPPPAWDTDGAYTRASVRVYIVRGATSATEKVAAIKLKRKQTLAQVVATPNYTVPLYPTLYVVVKGSDAEQAFLDGLG